MRYFQVTTEEISPYLDAVKFDAAVSLFPLARAARVRSPRQAADRARRCAAEIALRRLLREAGEDYRALEIAYTPEGKPYFPARTDLAFSLSHSGSLACAALYREEGGAVAPALGADIQEIPVGEKRGKLLALAARYFSPGFRAELESAPEDARAEVFTRLWCETEAVAKATGRGGADFQAAETLLQTARSQEFRLLSDSCGRRYGMAVVLLG